MKLLGAMIGAGITGRKAFRKKGSWTEPERFGRFGNVKPKYDPYTDYERKEGRAAKLSKRYGARDALKRRIGRGLESGRKKGGWIDYSGMDR